jgi:hypothetical protein
MCAADDLYVMSSGMVVLETTLGVYFIFLFLDGMTIPRL